MSSLSQLVKTLRDANIVLPAQVNYGFTDGLVPPYISLGEYKYEWERDTQNGIKHVTFSVLTVAKSVEEAEALAGQVDTVLTNNYSATDQDVGLLQDTYEVGQTDPPNLYQYGVKMTYSLWDDPNK
jgi:hypothetical protein